MGQLEFKKQKKTTCNVKNNNYILESLFSECLFCLLKISDG